MPFCSKCGFQVKDGEVFCEKCGTRIRINTESPKSSRSSRTDKIYECNMHTCRHCGTISFHISDYARFIELHRLDEFDLDRFTEQIRSAVIKYVKNVVMNAPERYSIPVVQLERKLPDLDSEIGKLIKDQLESDFGVAVNATDISAVEIDTESEGCRELMHITRDITSAKIKAQSQADVRSILRKQRIEDEHYEKSLRSK